MKKHSQGYVLLEVLIAVIFFLILASAVARMFSATTDIFRKNISSTCCRLIAEKQACLAMADPVLPSAAQGTETIKKRGYFWRISVFPWDHEKNLYLINIHVNSEQTNQDYEIDFIKKHPGLYTD